MQRGRASPHPGLLSAQCPGTTDDVAAFVRSCEIRGIPVRLQGHAAEPAGGHIEGAAILSLSGLDRIRAIDRVNQTMTVEAGCSLGRIREAARDAGMLFPPRLASEADWTIGAALASNAGAMGTLRFGTARELCLGLEVVTPQGDIWSSLRAQSTQAPACDLRSLHIGAEGSLGIITAAVLRLQAMPAAHVAALVAVPSLRAALDLFVLARGMLDASLGAFELMSAACLNTGLPAACPLPGSDTPWYVLLEASGMWGEHEAAELVESVLADAVDRGILSDAVVSSGVEHCEALWALREGIGRAPCPGDPDGEPTLFVPMSALPEMIEGEQRAVLDQCPYARRMVIGHMGGAPGRERADLQQDEIEHRLACALKDALDPKGLMNPGRPAKRASAG